MLRPEQAMLENFQAFSNPTASSLTVDNLNAPNQKCCF